MVQKSQSCLIEILLHSAIEDNGPCVCISLVCHSRSSGIRSLSSGVFITCTVVCGILIQNVSLLENHTKQLQAFFAFTN